MKRMMSYLFGNIIQQLLGNQRRIESKIDDMLIAINSINDKVGTLERRFNLKDHKDRQNYGHIQYKLQEVSDHKKPKLDKKSFKKAH